MARPQSASSRQGPGPLPPAPPCWPSPSSCRRVVPAVCVAGITGLNFSRVTHQQYKGSSLAGLLPEAASAVLVLH